MAEAVALIDDNVFVDFPFASEADKANAWALLLLGFMRNMVNGPTPIHWLDKSTPGTGASLLADVVSLIQTGADMPKETAPTTEDEWRKKITAALLSGSPYVCFDNVSKGLDSQAIASVVTLKFWSDRILGSSETVRVPVTQIFVVTANNLKASNEMFRRLVRIRLDAKVERPEDRASFKHARLKEWVEENRPELVRACLTVIQSWVANGMVKGSKRKGSYEAWVDAMGGVLENAGIRAFLDNEAEVAASDESLEATRGFVAAWWEAVGSARVRARYGESASEIGLLDIMDGLETKPSEYLELVKWAKTGADSTVMGKYVGELRGRVFRIDGIDLRVTRSEKASKGVMWWWLEEERARADEV